MEEVERQEKNGSGLTGAQNPTWFQILNPVLSDTNEGMNGICSSPADTSLSDFLRQEEGTKEVGIFFLEYFLSTLITHVNYLKLIISYASKHP